MKTALGFSIASLLAALVVGGAAAAAAGAPQETKSAQAGSYLFGRYCAACHGASARGDGPLAESFKRRPPNLTEIVKREGGTFPKDKVYRIIDGRQRVAGHGGPDMPVWGDAFRRSIEGGDEAAIAARIQAIVDYLESIQVRTGP